MSKHKTVVERILIVAGMCTRLKETDDLCKQIAIDATGRHDTGARLFKKVTGLSLTQYRERIKHGSAKPTAQGASN